jgi:hypothetical protein
MIPFYCFRFETPPTWRPRSPYLYPSGTGWPDYTPIHCVPFSSPPISVLFLHSLSVSKKTIVYHTATGWFPRTHLHGNVFTTQRRVGFQESISMETPLPIRSLAMGLHVRTSETSVDLHRTTRRYIPGHVTLHNHGCENLRYNIIMNTEPTVTTGWHQVILATHSAVMVGGLDWNPANNSKLK